MEAIMSISDDTADAGHMEDERERLEREKALLEREEERIERERERLDEEQARIAATAKAQADEALFPN